MKLRLLVAALSALVVTACGGGGGNSSSTPTPAPAPVTQTTPTPSPTPTTPAESIPNSLATTTKFGESYLIQKGTTTSRAATVENNVQNLNHLIIYISDYKGEPRHTYLYEDTNPVWNTKTDGSYAVTNIGTTMSYARFGMVKDDYAEHQAAFYQGHQTLTKDVPTTGTAIYQGVSVYTCKTCNGFKTGDATITANFGSKSLTGNLAGIGEKGESGAILATISGNTFSSTTPFEGTRVKGAFFGSQAEEVSGVFINETRGTLGAFGGKR